MNKWSTEFAKNYHESLLIEQKYLMGPLIMKMIKRNSIRRVADFGCGSGRYCRMVAKAGKKVIGLEKNRQQIGIAMLMEKNQKLGIKYVQSDITSKIISSKLPAGSVDAALLSFVVIELESTAKIKKLFKNILRTLRKNGILLICEVHPNNLGRISYVNTSKILNGKDSYFTNGARIVSSARALNGKKIVFLGDRHYTLEFLINSLIETGFEISSVKELSYKEDFPTHIAIIAKKV